MPFPSQAWAIAEKTAGHPAEARSLFQRCLQVDPRCVQALHAWASMEAALGDKEAARKLFYSALGATPVLTLLHSHGGSLWVLWSS